MKRSDIRTGELTQVVLAALTFFLILSSYYILRPVRDEMGVRTGTGRLPWLFTATFVATLLLVPVWGWIVARVPRQRLLPFTYGFIITNILIFLFVMSTNTLTAPIAIAFFVWASVINLFVVSLFWSTVSDVFTTDQSHRLYGFIAAGGTAGALAGPALTASIADKVPTPTLLLISAIGFTFATIAATMLIRSRRAEGERTVREPKIGGGVLAGIRLTLQSRTLLGIALIIICYTTISTLLYFEQNDVVGKTIADPGERTAFFATIDLMNNSFALLMQILGTAWIVKRFGVRAALSLIPTLIVIGWMILGFHPEAVVLALLQVVHRGGDFSLVRPGREMIYTTVDPESRYKAKNFIDTTVYRANDAVSGWLTDAIRTGGLYAVIAAGILYATAWAITGYRIGRRHDERKSELRAEPA